jgi:hypothetical protein
MKLYFKLLLNIVVVVVSFGIILPFLISFPDTLLVVAGLVYAFVLLPAFLYYFNRGIATQIMESLKQ